MFHNIDIYTLVEYQAIKNQNQSENIGWPADMDTTNRQWLKLILK